MEIQSDHVEVIWVDNNVGFGAVLLLLCTARWRSATWRCVTTTCRSLGWIVTCVLALSCHSLYRAVDGRHVEIQDHHVRIIGVDNVVGFGTVLSQFVPHGGGPPLEDPRRPRTPACDVR